MKFYINPARIIAVSVVSGISCAYLYSAFVEARKTETRVINVITKDIKALVDATK